MQFRRIEAGDREGRPREEIGKRSKPGQAGVQWCDRHFTTVLQQSRPMSKVLGLIRKSEQIHLMSRRDSPQLMEGANLLTLIRGVRNAMANVKNPHKLLLVGGNCARVR